MLNLLLQVEYSARVTGFSSRLAHQILCRTMKLYYIECCFGLDIEFL